MTWKIRKRIQLQARMRETRNLLGRLLRAKAVVLPPKEPRKNDERVGNGVDFRF
jgi:hypothetical protein